MTQETMTRTTDNEMRITKAKEVIAAINETKPVKEWGMTASLWTALDGRIRIYVNDKKRQAAAIIIVLEDGSLRAEWQKGNSLTRDELRAALGVQ